MRTHVRYMFVRIRDTDVHLKARDYCLMVDRNQYNQSAWGLSGDRSTSGLVTIRDVDKNRRAHLFTVCWEL